METNILTFEESTGFHFHFLHHMIDKYEITRDDRQQLVELLQSLLVSKCVAWRGASWVGAACRPRTAGQAGRVGNCS